MAVGLSILMVHMVQFYIQFLLLIGAKEFATWCNLGKCFVLTDAQMRASKIPKDKHSIVDLRYNRTEAFKNF